MDADQNISNVVPIPAQAGVAGDFSLKSGNAWPSNVNFPFMLRELAADPTRQGLLAHDLIEQLKRNELLDPDTVCISPFQGNNNLTFTAQTRSGDDVIIRTRVGDDSRYQLEKEFMNMARSSSNEAEQAIPRIYLVGTLGESLGERFSFSVQAKCSGVPLNQIADIALRAEVYERVGNIMRGIHEIPFNEEQSLGDPRQRLVEHVRKDRTSAADFLIGQGVFSREDWDGLRDRIDSFDWRHELKPCYVHDDLNMGNILVDRSTNKISIIDWEREENIEERPRERTGFAALGPYRELLGFIPLLQGVLRESFLRGTGVDLNEFRQSGLERDLDTVQLATGLGVAPFFHHLMSNGDARAAEHYQKLVTFFSELIADSQ